MMSGKKWQRSLCQPSPGKQWQRRSKNQPSPGKEWQKSQNQSSLWQDEKVEEHESIDSGCFADSSSEIQIDWKKVSLDLQEECSYIVNLYQTYEVPTAGILPSPHVISVLEKNISASSLTKKFQPPLSSENAAQFLTVLNKKGMSKEQTSSSILKSINVIVSSFNNAEEKKTLLQKLLEDLDKGKYSKLSDFFLYAVKRRINKKIDFLNSLDQEEEEKDKDKDEDESSCFRAKISAKKKKAKASAKKKKNRPKGNAFPNNIKEESAESGLSSKPAVKLNKNEGKLVFNKFEFSNAGDDERWSEKKQNNLHTALNKVLREKECVKELAEKGKVNSASNKVLNKGYENAMKKAQGIKVKDNPSLLQKSLSKRQNKKEKSKQTWEARQNSVEKRQEARQHRRLENIQLRRQKKKEAKLKRLEKKRRHVPGF